MSRYVDTLPTPRVTRPKKVIVASMGRNGTMGLYKALSILGYKPYHFVEIFKNGPPHLKMMTEAVAAAHLGEGKRYAKEDFEKWMPEYDSITDTPGFLVEDLYAAYPDAQYILTYRDPAAWIRSVHNTFVQYTNKANQFPRPLLKYFDPFLWNMLRMLDTLHRVLWGGGPTSDNTAALKYYADHNAKARKCIPADQLLEVKLEDGLGWEQICPFLGKAVPDVPYPHINDTTAFGVYVGGMMRAAGMKAMMRMLGLVVMPAVGVGAWYFLRYIK